MAIPSLGVGGAGSGLSLLSMLQGSGAQSPGGFGSMFSNPQAYWARVNASRQPGQSIWDTSMRGMLPQQLWPQQWRDERAQSEAIDPDVG